MWLGNDGGEPMSKVMGGGLPAALWRTVMQAAHERLPASTLPGMEQQSPSWVADTLRESDCAAAPVSTISELIDLEAGQRARHRPEAAGARPARAAETSRSQVTSLETAQESRTQVKRTKASLERVRDLNRPIGRIERDMIGRILDGHAATVDPVTAARPDRARPLPPVATRPGNGLMGLGVRPEQAE